MRLAFYGGMVNNLYVAARAFADLGARPLFIRDRDNATVFSQPCWQDMRLSLSFEQWSAANAWDWAAWSRWERTLGWNAPPWLADPLDDPQPMPALDARPHHAALVRWLYRNSPHAGAVLRLMRRCDAVVACGVHATILALVSGRPFCIWPHGSDIRMAAGLGPQAGGTSPRDRAAAALTRLLLRAAYRKARFATYANPTAGGGHTGNVREAGLGCPFRLVLFPAPLAPGPAGPRPEALRRTLEGLGLPAPGGAVVGLVPSRVDFFWKGQDMALHALAQAPRTEGLRLLFTGWGADLPRARDMAASLGLEDRVAFIPRVFSRPLLAELFHGADFALDQFRIGHPGTSALEAMGCGTPVVMRLDAAAYAREGIPAPPVINVATPRELAGAFTALAQGDPDPAALGRGAQAWLAGHHGAAAALRAITDGLEPGGG
ncbi:glycosyltransferase [Desulfocurvus sp.]|uniref:glycosyltransferase n=1 Tax=Desulfocurvus sp. TaxID=2871698 RepID=UPI0025B82C94|nr:glycosyltransferase [Desulfocurvus sp.]MCK9238825.1 glycosyltransferase [Desulfocurvus sp.]